VKPGAFDEQLLVLGYRLLARAPRSRLQEGGLVAEILAVQRAQIVQAFRGDAVLAELSGLEGGQLETRPLPVDLIGLVLQMVRDLRVGDLRPAGLGWSEPGKDQADERHGFVKHGWTSLEAAAVAAAWITLQFQ